MKNQQSDIYIYVYLQPIIRYTYIFTEKYHFETVARMGGHRVYVGGLPYGARERDLERFFKGYGRTKDILIKNGYGFVVSSILYMSITCLETYNKTIFYFRNLRINGTQTMRSMN